MRRLVIAMVSAVVTFATLNWIANPPTCMITNNNPYVGLEAKSHEAVLKFMREGPR